MWRSLLSLLAYFAIRIITGLLRYRFINRSQSLGIAEDGASCLYAFFHGRQLMLFGYPLPRPMVQMVSLSKDGDIQSGILQNFRYITVRGSPGKRGREALYEMADLVLHGCHAMLAVDGSKGPYQKAKLGILHLARDTGGVIIPLAAAARRKIVLEKTWDKYTIPMPFSPTVILEGEAVLVDPEIEDEDLEKLRAKLEKDLISLHRKAERIVNGEETVGNPPPIYGGS